MSQSPFPDYSLTGANAALAIERGLAEADWYTTPVPKEMMRGLLQRRDGPAIRDTLLLFSILAATGWATVHFWGTWWVVIPYLIYAVFYATSSDSRWHECGHGTAFKTDWMNTVLYEIASFMVVRESVVWRWSHNRHHSDTIIVGRDPEIQIPRPPDLRALFLSLFNISGYLNYFPNLLRHSLGRMSADEMTFIPESEFPKVYRNARICLALHLAVVATAVALQSWIPIFLFTLPNFFGTWLMIVHNTTQHAGLAENVLDHRLNCRTVYMNPVSRFIYWNMNYHLEHHMFPLVPYHALPKLHELLKDDVPEPYSGLFEAWSEIIPAVLRQVKDPAYHVKRKLPTPTVRPDAPATAHAFTARGQPVDGWTEICASAFLKSEDVIRFDHEERTYAIYRTADGALHATDGICTHGNTHLADGLVIGKLIECPKHNGRFDITDGSPQRAPVCVALKTYKAREHDGKIFIDLTSAGGCGAARVETTWKFRVVSNENVATFIKELVLEPESGSEPPPYQPGDYLQFDIPAYGEIAFDEITVSSPFDEVWRVQHVFDFRSENTTSVRRNYSLASNPATDKQLRFNVRIATPPRGQDCLAGAGSAWVHRLKPGDEVTAIGPFGTFHLQPGDREMVYVGGGAGMAPLRSHLSHLFETLNTGRRVSFWYGARSRQELFYQEYFEDLSRRFPNFTFHPALSEPLPGDDWSGPTGFIHEVLENEYLNHHPSPAGIEYYLCGPPVMINATREMLGSLRIPSERISYDEF